MYCKQAQKRASGASRTHFEISKISWGSQAPSLNLYVGPLNSLSSPAVEPPYLRHPLDKNNSEVSFYLEGE